MLCVMSLELTSAVRCWATIAKKPDQQLENDPALHALELCSWNSAPNVTGNMHMMSVKYLSEWQNSQNRPRILDEGSSLSSKAQTFVLANLVIELYLFDSVGSFPSPNP